MLLYWGIFTVGFIFGSILAFVTFAPKNPQDDPEYETPLNFQQIDTQSLSLSQSSAKNGLYKSNYRKLRLIWPFQKRYFEAEGPERSRRAKSFFNDIN